MQKIKTALCSFGMSGWVFHAPFLSTHPGFEFYGVWERSKDNAKQRYPQVTVFRTLEDMLEDKDIELVVVNTPNATHYEYTKACLAAGKHVICEKPFTVTVAEADDLISIAAAQNKCLSVFHNRRFDSDYKTIKTVLDKKLLGNIVEAEFHFDRFKEELSPKVHKETPGKGIGALYDLGSHLIDQALQLFGWPAALFADITAMRPISQVDDYFEVLLYYPHSRVRIKGSYQVREALPGYVIHGSKGSFIKPKTDVQEIQLQGGKLPTDELYGIEPETEKGLLHTEINGELIRETIASEKGNYTAYYEGIYQSIRNNRPLLVTAEQARDVIRILEAATASVEQQKIIPL
jgi:scyllo-inositol 2-dehydrogenase (NADP+)